jgi:outer membrane receptor protein involved in Fe transport
MLGFIYRQVLSSSFYFNFRSGYYNTKWADKSSANNSSHSKVFRNELQTNFTLGERTLLISGIENSIGNTTANLFGERSSFGAGIYSQLEYKFEFPLSITAGIRYDYNKIDSSDANDAFSPKAGINYKLSEQLILRSSLGKGFRAPSIAETFTSTNLSGIEVIPNPNLKAESSLSFEVGVLYKPFADISFDAAVFNNEYYDFIEPAVNSDGKYVFSNITRAKIQGVEFNQDYYFFQNNLNLFAGYVYLWARDLNTGESLKFRPRHVALVNLNYKFYNFETGLGFRYSSRVEEVDDNLTRIIIDGENRVDIYVLDFSIGYNLFSYGIPGRIFFNAKNLLNYYYVELIGNLAPLRNYSVNMELSF